ncbi:AAA family ATPase [Urbifossiella limnaea]|uniref:Chaperone protein ClpB n=1 Tax=Urbifossiella limnaea TaxID=2528023 RepID=A0A517Y204_9BACT|nr:AAA family ATPase [Urbifossiella limnaea]QDU23792.1 Chaperone protein ClpB [Urbifossiella limnaea]
MASDTRFAVGVVHRRVGPRAVLAEPLFFPEVARLAADPDAAAAMIRHDFAVRLPKLDTRELFRRRRATTARLVAFTVDVAPPRKTDLWRTPVALKLQAVAWEQAGFVVARIPALGVEVIAAPKDDLPALLAREALAALRRAELTKTLKALAGVATGGLRLDWLDVSARLPSLKERAARGDAERPKKTVLQTVASVVRPEAEDAAFEAEEVVAQLAEALAAKPPQSVLLVGPSGVGKSAAFGELVRRAAAYRLGATPFYRTTGSRLVAGQTGFGMWEERCQELIKEAAKLRAVLHVGSLTELMDVGKSNCNPTGIATFLRPAIARGELLCVAEATPEQLPLIEKEDPQLTDAFRQITVEEPGPDRGRRILRQFADADRRREPTPEALAAIDRLHRRYATYSAYPGRPLRFLDRLRRDGPPRTPIGEGEVFTGFGRETGLPAALLDPAVPLDPAATRDWFADRVVGQPEAVSLVADLLATVKAGLARPNRPVASLLFVGPTGVGKTEMAKALAEFLFGSADRLTRFDMSEYADPVAVRRLVGSAFNTEGLLTAAVREQPFCVLLLDEVEKADASAFDLLLQALGEARLTDAGGRLADFRNAVVILTSNLGAESFRAGSAGFGADRPTAAGAAAHFTRAVEQALRPEMVNRLDRVVPFAPLGPDVVRRIADREWAKVLARDGLRFRNVRVTTGEGLLDRIAAVGFDPRYGARPLKRAMERDLLAPLARQMNRHPGDAPLSVAVGVAAGDIAVTVRPVPGAKGGGEPASPVGRQAAQAQERRRWHQLLAESTAVRDVENEVVQLAQVEQRVRSRQARGKPQRPGDAAALARLGRLRELAVEVRRQRVAAEEVEDAAVVAFHADAADPALAPRLAAGAADWDALLFRLYAASRPGADRVTLVLYSEHRGHLAALADAYRSEAERHRIRAEGRVFAAVTAEEARLVEAREKPPKFPKTEGDEPVTAWGERWLWEKAGSAVRVVMRAEPRTDELPDGAIGVALELTGPAADLRFAAEAGLHEFVGTPAEEGNPDVLVRATGEKLMEYRPPVAMVRRGAVKADETRRVYDRGKGRVDDAVTGEAFEGLWGELAALLPPVLAANARHRLRVVVLE